jgi:cyanophycin synthetase
MNLFQFKQYQVMVDYAHNSAGFQAISKFLEKIDATSKVGVIAGVGDRRDEDIISLGKLAAQMFDKIIIRQDKNLRGRTEQEIINLMLKGINEINSNKLDKVFGTEKEAIEYALKTAKKGSFITICSDVVPDALDQIMKHKEKEDKFEITPEDIKDLQPETIKQ